MNALQDPTRGPKPFRQFLQEHFIDLIEYIIARAGDEVNDPDSAELQEMPEETIAVIEQFRAIDNIVLEPNKVWDLFCESPKAVDHAEIDKYREFVDGSKPTGPNDARHREFNGVKPYEARLERLKNLLATRILKDGLRVMERDGSLDDMVNGGTWKPREKAKSRDRRDEAARSPTGPMHTSTTLFQRSAPRFFDVEEEDTPAPFSRAMAPSSYMARSPPRSRRIQVSAPRVLLFDVEEDETPAPFSKAMAPSPNLLRPRARVSQHGGVQRPQRARRQRGYWEFEDGKAQKLAKRLMRNTEFKTHGEVTAEDVHNAQMAHANAFDDIKIFWVVDRSASPGIEKEDDQEVENSEGLDEDDATDEEDPVGEGEWIGEDVSTAGGDPMDEDKIMDENDFAEDGGSNWEDSEEEEDFDEPAGEQSKKHWLARFYENVDDEEPLPTPKVKDELEEAKVKEEDLESDEDAVKINKEAEDGEVEHEGIEVEGEDFETFVLSG